MKPDKTTTDFDFLLPKIIENIIILILADFDNTPEEAVDAFYASPTYELLENPKTEFWKKTPQELYQDFLTTTHRI